MNISLSQQEYLNEKTMLKSSIAPGSIIVTNEYYFMVTKSPRITERRMQYTVLNLDTHCMASVVCDTVEELICALSTDFKIEKIITTDKVVITERI